ncbi:hypothetical protein ABW20_dc0100645 [Dactylellina cionopaga]|nr:hypothetical protein ABW20_dc0100645 [Dactylellina cionopaga]
MSKTEFDSLSAAELAAFEARAQLRTPEDIISDLDCLLYLKSELEEGQCKIGPTFVGWPMVPKGDQQVDHHLRKVVTTAQNRISAVIEEIPLEAQTTIHRLASIGDGIKAYFLTSLCYSRIHYSKRDISRDYGEVGMDNILSDKSSGLIFRWFKSLGVVAKYQNFAGVNKLPKIGQNDITNLYQTLRRVTSICSTDSTHDIHTYKGDGFVKLNIFWTISPLIFRALSLVQESNSTPIRWVLNAIEECGCTFMLHSKSIDGNTPLHLAVLMDNIEAVECLVRLHERAEISDLFRGVDVTEKQFPPCNVAKLPFTSFMLAIFYGRQLSIKFFLRAKKRWQLPSTASLSFLFGKTFAAYPEIKNLALQPIHIAAIMEQYDIFKPIFIRQKDQPNSIYAAVAVTLFNNNIRPIGLLAQLELSKTQLRNLRDLVEIYGNSKVKKAYIFAFDVTEWSARAMLESFSGAPSEEVDCLEATQSIPSQTKKQNSQSQGELSSASMVSKASSAKSYLSIGGFTFVLPST